MAILPRRVRLSDVLVRLCVIAIALLLVAAPVEAAENVDIQAEHVFDAIVDPVGIPLAAPTPARIAITRSENVPPPSPAMTRVFRPPRAALAR